MDSNIAITRSRLEHAEALLREVLDRDFHNSQKAEGGSLGRMLVHIVNMNHAVSTSTDANPNVAKRLGDFALMTSRITVPDGDPAERLARLVAALKSAKAGLEVAPADVQQQAVTDVPPSANDA